MIERDPTVFRLPSPWLPPDVFRDAAVMGSQTIIGPAAWPSANLAIYCPVSLPASATIRTLSFACTVLGNNYDLGIYTGDLAKVDASGSTALATGVVSFTLTKPYRVQAGQLFYLALAISGTTGQVQRYSGGAVGQVIATGAGQEASALPLPSTATPVTLTSAYVPLIALGFR